MTGRPVLSSEVAPIAVELGVGDPLGLGYTAGVTGPAGVDAARRRRRRCGPWDGVDAVASINMG